MYWFKQNVEAPKATVAFGASKKMITPVRGLQILTHSRIFLHYRGTSFKIAMSKLVNSHFKLTQQKIVKIVYPLTYSIIAFLLNTKVYLRAIPISWRLTRGDPGQHHLGELHLQGCWVRQCQVCFIFVWYQWFLLWREAWTHWVIVFYITCSQKVMHPNIW